MGGMDKTAALHAGRVQLERMGTPRPFTASTEAATWRVSAVRAEADDAAFFLHW